MSERDEIAEEMRVVLEFKEHSYSPAPYDCADVAMKHIASLRAELAAEKESCTAERERAERLWDALATEKERVKHLVERVWQKSFSGDYEVVFETLLEDIRASNAAPVGAKQSYAEPTDSCADGGDTGNAEADRIIDRLMSSDPDFSDCSDAALLIRKLVVEHRGPDGFATWKDAAIHERQLRTSNAAPPQTQTVDEGWDPWTRRRAAQDAAPPHVEPSAADPRIEAVVRRFPNEIDATDAASILAAADAAAREAGWVLVPVVPTRKMQLAGLHCSDDAAALCWDAMRAAASSEDPTP